MDRFAGMRAFTRVVEKLGFAAAARDMGLSRSAVNKAVIALENELGVQLLQRSTRKVTPTDTGLAFYDRARGLLADYDDAVAAVRDSRETPSGTLRVNAPMSFGMTYLRHAVADFLREYPRLRIELLLNDRPVDTIEEGFDVTLRIASPSYLTSVIRRDIAPVRRVLCASPEYLAAAPPLSKPEDLREHRCLQYGYSGVASQWRLAGEGGERAYPIHCVMWSNNGEVLAAAAMADQGIALLPEFIVAPELADGALVVVLPEQAPGELTLSAVYPRHRHLSSKVTVFVDALVARFASL
ncbi:MAG: LysR family transcriptional regulator [Pseudomonadota bacterium]